MVVDSEYAETVVSWDLECVDVEEGVSDAVAVGDDNLADDLWLQS